MDFPSISKETLESAVQDLQDQYSDLNGREKCVPQVVFLEELPSYNDFFAKFLVPNQLCVLSEAATSQWRSRQEWVCQDGSPNITVLQRSFGDATVPVANCKRQEFSAHCKQEMKMREFLTYWHRHREAGHPSENESLYLKDWHFTRDFPDYKAYSTCSFFQSDWLNEFLDVSKDVDDDYRFVYMGPKNTWTSFHCDVFHSYSWSANICGRKRWVFFPPGEEVHLKDIHNTLVYDVNGKELEDSRRFPTAHKVQHRIEIIQQPGETIFVPSGWHHQVENLEDTISINHNWLNSCSVRQCWAHLKASLADVEREISDCRDMEGWGQQCQIILKSLTGMNYDEFFRFMESVARRRIDALSTWKQKSENTTSHFGTAFPRSRDDAETQPSVSEQRQPCPHSKDSRDREAASSSRLHQHGEDVLDLSKGAELNGRIPNPPHWSFCNVNHAVFDLACVALVLKDMRHHLSVKLGPETEEHKGQSDSQTDTNMHDHQNGVGCRLVQDPGKASLSPEEVMLRSIQPLLKEISGCLSAFGVEGSWGL